MTIISISFSHQHTSSTYICVWIASGAIELNWAFFWWKYRNIECLFKWTILFLHKFPWILPFQRDKVAVNNKFREDDTAAVVAARQSDGRSQMSGLVILADCSSAQFLSSLSFFFLETGYRYWFYFFIFRKKRLSLQMQRKRRQEVVAVSLWKIQRRKGIQNCFEHVSIWLLEMSFWLHGASSLRLL